MFVDWQRGQFFGEIGLVIDGTESMVIIVLVCNHVKIPEMHWTSEMGSVIDSLEFIHKLVYNRMRMFSGMEWRGEFHELVYNQVSTSEK